MNWVISMQAIDVFKHLIPLFHKAGFQIYMVGGSARDYLLKRDFNDLDLATDATPDQLIELFPEANDVFAKYGNVHFVIDEVNVDITTMRTESDYSDARHPRKITFVQSIELDAHRRDFTINAFYVDTNFVVHDFFGGLKDLSQGVIRMIGEPNMRLIEDPLRILRALRFAITLDFAMDESLQQAIIFQQERLTKIKKVKIKQELEKMRLVDPNKAKDILDKYKIHGW